MGNCYNAMDELQGGEGKAAKRKSGAGSKGGGHRSWKNSGKMNSLGKNVCEECISEEFLAIRKAIKRSSPKNRCEQSLGKRTNFKVNLMATESFLFISNMTGLSINSRICKAPMHLK